MFLFLTALFIGTFIFSICSPRGQEEQRINSAWKKERTSFRKKMSVKKKTK